MKSVASHSRVGAMPGYAVACLAVGVLTALAWPLRGLFLPPNLIMLYLLVVALVARRYQRGPAILASALAVAAFDFFFVHPQLTFAVADVQYVLTFAVMLLVGIVISNLAGQLEAQVLARASTQTEIANEQLRSSLLSSISHDLRTPLASISGAAGTLLTLSPTETPASAPVLLTTIRDESDRLATLVSNILEMTRLEAGPVKLNLEWLPLEEPIGAAISALDPRRADRRVIVELPSDLPMVRADAVLIERIFENLLDNALRYTPPDQPIEVRASCLSDAVVLTVADRGPGLSDVVEADLFVKFGRARRADATSSTASRGTGLGLSICKAIVEAHGGSIRASNRAGGGAEFTFTLPLTEDQPVLPAESREGAEYGR
jgi:two-component system sensor histidine kinase KdpD